MRAFSCAVTSYTDADGHEHAPDKKPRTRLAMIRRAGKLRIPFTTGILIGLGETEDERIDALLAIRDLHDEYGHIQEVIVQNFRAKAGTAMRGAPEPDEETFLAAVATARVLLGPGICVQAPPNLSDPAQQLRVRAALRAARAKIARIGAGIARVLRRIWDGFALAIGSLARGVGRNAAALDPAHRRAGLGLALVATTFPKGPARNAATAIFAARTLVVMPPEPTSVWMMIALLSGMLSLGP